MILTLTNEIATIFTVSIHYKYRLVFWQCGIDWKGLKKLQMSADQKLIAQFLSSLQHLVVISIGVCMQSL